MPDSRFGKVYSSPSAPTKFGKKKNFIETLVESQGKQNIQANMKGIEDIIFKKELSQKPSPDQPIPTSGTSPYGVKYETKQGIDYEAEKAAAIEKAKKQASMTPERKVLNENIQSMINLFRQAPRPEPGIINRPAGALGNMITRQSQTLPQIDQYEDFKKAIAGDLARVVGGETGARLSDFDIQRMINVIPDIIGDTEDRGLLGFSELFRTIDDTLTSYGSTPENLEDKLFAPEQKIRTIALRGDLARIESLSDEELVDLINQDVSPFGKVTKEKLLNEIEKRGLA